MIAILELVRRGKLRERYSLLFLLVSSSIFILAIFGKVLAGTANSLEVSYRTSLLVGVAFIVTFSIQIAQGVIISSLSLHCRDLAQKVAELEWQICQLRHCARMWEKQQKEHVIALPTTICDVLTPAGENK